MLPAGSTVLINTIHEIILIALMASACDHGICVVTLIRKFIVSKWDIETSCQESENAEVI